MRLSVAICNVSTMEKHPSILITQTLKLKDLIELLSRKLLEFFPF